MKTVLSRHPGPRNRQAPLLPQVSPRLIQLFAWYAQRYLQRSFHAVRLAHGERLAQVGGGPLVVYSNHPSWWDPLLCFFLAYHLFPTRTHYAPMAAEALARYRFFARLGFFGVAPGTSRGAAAFLRQGRAILRHPRTALWITPEGQLTDPRQRPVRLQAGIGHLARQVQSGFFVPLALEYPFWAERFPEALAYVGEPIDLRHREHASAAAWTALCTDRLAVAQEHLAAAARQRQPEAFTVLLPGRAGVGGVYDVWRAWRARLGGTPFRKAHGEEQL